MTSSATSTTPASSGKIRGWLRIPLSRAALVICSLVENRRPGLFYFLLPLHQ